MASPVAMMIGGAILNAMVEKDVAKRWLTKQALWQIYLPAPRYIPRPKFDVSLPNAVHQADLLFCLMTNVTNTL